MTERTPSTDETTDASTDASTDAEKLEALTRELETVRAERDAALAVIELSKVDASKHPEHWEYFYELEDAQKTLNTPLVDAVRALQADAWDAALEYVRTELRNDYDAQVSRIRIPNLTNKHIQPCFDAIDATGVMTYIQYNAHIASVQLSSALDWFTVHPAVPDGEGGFFEPDDDPNPYRSAAN